MSAAYFIVLEREIDGVDTAMCGKSLSRHIESLDAAARQLGVRPPSAFFSMSAEMVAALVENPEDMTLPPFQQFSAQDGLTTISALASDPIAQTHSVAEDLGQCERILRAAAQHNISWHFEIDV
jgi:hypothetical protein